MDKGILELVILKLFVFFLGDGTGGVEGLSVSKISSGEEVKLESLITSGGIPQGSALGSLIFSLLLSLLLFTSVSESVSISGASK